MKKIIILAVLIVALIILLTTFNYLNRIVNPMTEVEKEAAIAKILGRKPNLETAEQKGDVNYNGKYVSFTYPGNASIEKQLLNGQEVPYDGLERFIFKMDNPKVRVYVEVIDKPSNVASLPDFPSVKLRQLQSNLYEQEDEYAGDVRGLVFSKKGNLSYEKAAFFDYLGRIYSFSFAGSGLENVTKVYEKVMTSAKLF